MGSSFARSSTSQRQTSSRIRLSERFGVQPVVRENLVNALTGPHMHLDGQTPKNSPGRVGFSVRFREPVFLRVLERAFQPFPSQGEIALGAPAAHPLRRFAADLLH